MREILKLKIRWVMNSSEQNFLQMGIPAPQIKDVVDLYIDPQEIAGFYVDPDLDVLKNDDDDSREITVYTRNTGSFVLPYSEKSVTRLEAELQWNIAERDKM